MLQSIKPNSKGSIKQFFLKNLLVLFFAYDFIIKVIVHSTQIGLFYNYVIVFKVLAVFCFLLFYGYRKVNRNYLIPVLGLSLAYLVTQVSYYGVMTISDIQFNGYYFLSSIIPIIFILFCTDIEAEIIKTQVSRLLWFLGLSSVFVLIGYLLDLDIFRSYFRGRRFGYSGLLLYHHEAGFIYFLFINLLYYRLKKNFTRRNIFLFLFVLMISLLVGTKKTLFLVFIFFIYLLIDNIKNIKVLLATLISAIIGSFIFYDSLNKYYLLFNRIYQNDGFLSSFLSYRNVLFKDNFYPYVMEEKGLLNIISGWPFFNKHRTEMEVVDAFLFFGVIGIVCYLIFIYKLLKGKSKLTYFIVISLLVATILSGNLLASVNVMIMLFFTIKYINQSEEVIK